MPRVARAFRAGKQKNASELLFEAYLNEQHVTYEFEPQIAGKQKNPDYHVTWRDHKLFCEVKGLHSTRPAPTGVRYVNPYSGIRKKINEARVKFREYKREACCVLVIHNVSDWEFHDWPFVLFGAMLGDAGLSIPFDAERSIMLSDQARPAFLGGGKMIDPKRMGQQNTGISAIAVLSERTIRNPEFDAAYKERVSAMRARTGAQLTLEQEIGVRLALYPLIPVTLGCRPRVGVFENPFARHALPEEVFRGALDERHRFNRSLGRIERVFAGDELRESERGQREGADIAQSIEDFCQEVVRRFAPTRIVLFGSYAYGCPDPGSDVDLLVVFPGNGNAADRAMEIQKRINRSFPLDLLTISERDLARRLKLKDPFLREVVAKGKTLYEAAHS